MAAVLAVAAFVGLLAYGVAAQAPDTTIDDDLSRGAQRAAPGFELPVLARGSAPAPVSRVIDRVTDDATVRLKELRGSPVVLNFWASWCEPCRVEASILEREWQRSASKGVVFLGVDQQDNTRDARDFLGRHKTTYLNLREAGSEASRRYGTTGLPETFFVSASGDVVGHVAGAIDARQLRTGVAAAIRGVPAPAQRGGASE